VTHLIPHVWIQPTGFGPNVYAGQIIDSEGRAARYLVRAGRTSSGQQRQEEGQTRLPIHLAPLTRAGFDQLATQLAEDIKAAAA
jgi:hypothetical protein